MKIAVIAANGRSGKAFVEAALKNEHTINAGIKGFNSLPENNSITLFECDATNKTHVDALIKGCDAVVSFIGHVKGSPELVQTESMQVIVEAMKANNIKRLVSLTGTGVRQEGDNITLIDRILNLSISIIDPKRVNDGEEHAKVLQNSGLDWTIIRVLKLTNRNPSAFSLSSHGPAKTFIARGEVALAALELLEKQSFIGEMPIISKA